MHIQHQPHANGGRFSAREHEQTLGHLDYRWLSDSMIDAHHTFVDPAARGRGVAEALLQALAEQAQTAGLRIRPSCSYVAKKLPLSHPHLLADPT